MALPDNLQLNFEAQVKRYKEETKMPLLSRMELRAQKQTARESVLEVLELRFKPMPTEIAEAIDVIEDMAVLKHLHRQAVTSASLEAFHRELKSLSE